MLRVFRQYLSEPCARADKMTSHSSKEWLLGHSPRLRRAGTGEPRGAPDLGGPVAKSPPAREHRGIATFGVLSTDVELRIVLLAETLRMFSGVFLVFRESSGLASRCAEMVLAPLARRSTAKPWGLSDLSACTSFSGLGGALTESSGLASRCASIARTQVDG